MPRLLTRAPCPGIRRRCRCYGFGNSGQRRNQPSVVLCSGGFPVEQGRMAADSRRIGSASFRNRNTGTFMHDWSFDFLRRQIVGIDSAFDTPFGRRLMVYLRLHGVGPLPDLRRALPADAAAQLREHAHEDDVTGPQHEPPAARSGGDDQARGQCGHRRAAIVACGTGATGAIDKLQQILGVSLAPATRKVLGDELRSSSATSGSKAFAASSSTPAGRVRRALRAPLERGDLAAGLATVVEVTSRRMAASISRTSTPAAAARIPGTPAHRLVLGGIQCDWHAVTGA